MEILKGVVKKSIFIIIPALILSGFYFDERKWPLGIFMGWLFGVINLRQLTRHVEGLIGTERATLKFLLLSISRLLALGAAIFLLIYYRMVNVLGLLLGFTVVFILILVEGARQSK